MTIRDELKLLGPERVRAGMIAFEHRRNGFTDACSGGWCCFLTHATGSAILAARRSMKVKQPTYQGAVSEAAFEGWAEGTVNLGPDDRAVMREGLRQECIAFLAEHGDAPETRPASRETAGVGECRFGRGE